MSAHIYGQGINLLTIIVLPSVAVAHWGVYDFGLWLTVSAIAQLFMMIDFGWSLATQNQLCMKPERRAGEIIAILDIVLRRIFKNFIIFALGIFLIYFIISQGYVTKQISSIESEIITIFVVMSLSFCLQPLITLYGAILRFFDRNEYGVLFTNTGRMFELGVLITIIAMNHNLFTAALSIAIVRFVVVVAMFSHSHFFLKKMRLGSRSEIILLDDAEIESLKKAAAGFTSIALSQHFILNGPIVIITAVIGPVQGAIFAACRTLSRIPVLPISMFLTSLSPELTILASTGRYEYLKKVIRKVSIFSFLLVVFVNVILVNLHQQIEYLWFANKLKIDLLLLIILCSSSLILVLNQTIGQAMIAFNKTRFQGTVYLISYISCLMGIQVALLLFKTALVAAIMLLVVEIVILAFLLFEFRFIYGINDNTSGISSS